MRLGLPLASGRKVINDESVERRILDLLPNGRAVSDFAHEYERLGRVS